MVNMRVGTKESILKILPSMVISKVVKHLERGVSMTSAGTGFVRFILLHNPETTCPRINRLVLGISGGEIIDIVPENQQFLILI